MRHGPDSAAALFQIPSLVIAIALLVFGWRLVRWVIALHGALFFGVLIAAVAGFIAQKLSDSLFDYHASGLRSRGRA